jgi:hypothetical protein
MSKTREYTNKTQIKIKKDKKNSYFVSIPFWIAKSLEWKQGDELEAYPYFDNVNGILLINNKQKAVSQNAFKFHVAQEIFKSKPEQMSVFLEPYVHKALQKSTPLEQIRILNEHEEALLQPILESLKKYKLRSRKMILSKKLSKKNLKVNYLSYNKDANAQYVFENKSADAQRVLKKLKKQKQGS